MSIKITVFVLGILLLGINAYADNSAEWFIFSQSGLQTSLVSQEVPMEGMDYSFNSPTATDPAGNFYYCASVGNPQGALWIIRRVNRLTGSSGEVCRLNLDKYQSGAIRAIEFTRDGTLYVWLTLKTSGTKYWTTALVGITGF